MRGPVVVTTPEELLALIREGVRLELAAQQPPAAEWVDTSYTAAILGRHPKTVAAMARRGELPAKRLGNQWRFRRSDLDAHLNGERVG